MSEKKYTVEEIKKIAPGYRGKPENFDPARAGKKRDGAPKPKGARPGPSSPEVPPPTHPQSEPTAQRNSSVIAESIFGVDVTVTEIAPRQEFDAAYHRLVDVALDTYNNIQTDERQMDRIIAKEEVAYYATALLWSKLLDVKVKEGAVALTTEEKAIRKAVAEEQFNVPQPIFAMLSEIGNYTDRLGKETRHHVPNLPISIVQGFGGCHAAAITVDTHNLFEEVPSLGIAGDVVMALTMPEAEPQPNFRIGIPVGARVTKNLVGNTSPIGPRRPAIQQRLAGFGITATTFPEYVRGTRFNLKYVKSISDIFGKFETFRNEKVCFKNMTLAGGETQVVKSKPSEIRVFSIRKLEKFNPTHIFAIE